MLNSCDCRRYGIDIKQTIRSSYGKAAQCNIANWLGLYPMPVHNRRATPVGVGSNPTVTHRFRYNVHSGQSQHLLRFFLTFF